MKLITQAKQKLHDLPGTVAESLHLDGFWDRHETDRRFRLRTRAGGMALLGMGVWLGYEGIVMRLDDIQEGTISATEPACFVIGGATLVLALGAVLSVGNKAQPPGPSFAELDAREAARRQPQPGPTRADLEFGPIDEEFVRLQETIALEAPTEPVLPPPKPIKLSTE